MYDQAYYLRNKDKINARARARYLAKKGGKLRIKRTAAYWREYQRKYQKTYKRKPRVRPYQPRSPKPVVTAADIAHLRDLW